MLSHTTLQTFAPPLVSDPEGIALSRAQPPQLVFGKTLPNGGDVIPCLQIKQCFA